MGTLLPSFENIRSAVADQFAETEGASIEDDILIWRQWCHICHKKQARLAAVTNGLAVRDDESWSNH